MIELRQLFEYQRFVENPVLQQMIQSTQDRYMNRRQVLDDTDAALVAAAGTETGEVTFQSEQAQWEREVKKFLSEE